MNRERDEFRLRLAQKDDELAELRLTLDEQLQEYSDLLDIKIRLDREIDAYGKLLQSEETRSVAIGLFCCRGLLLVMMASPVQPCALSLIDFLFAV